MPGLPGAVISLTLPQILARDNQNLVVRLSSAPLPVPLVIAGIVPCDFPGYLPARKIRWQRGGNLADASTCIISGVTHFEWLADIPGTQAVRAAYLTWEPTAATPVLLGAAEFRVPQDIEFLFPHLHMRVTVQAYTLSDVSQSKWLLVFDIDPTLYAGASTLRALSGYDLQVIHTLKQSLDGALRRDADIPDLTDRSTRSRIPLVSAGDTQLAAAVSLLQARLNTLLGVAPTSV